MKMSGKVSTRRPLRERPARPQPPRRLLKVGDKVTQRCPSTGYLFEYQVTKVNSPTSYSMIVVGMVEERAHDA